MNTTNRKSIQEQINQAGPHANGKTTKLYRIGNADFQLQVTPTGVKSWIYRYTINGRTRVMGLGPIRRVSFDNAKKLARKVRVLLDDGVDPLAERDRLKHAKAAEQAQSMTFRMCAEAYIKAHQTTWTKKHGAQWPATLETYAYPVIGDMSVAKVDVHAIRKIIEPIWHTKNETADRLRARIEKVLGWATVSGYRHGDNPARWTAHLSELFPRRSKVRTIKHHPALPYAEMPAFMQRLMKMNTVSSWALRLLAYTACRTTEVRAATWDEMDLEGKTWHIPAERMKARRPHRVPLSEPALEVIRCMKAFNDKLPEPSKYVFPGQKKGTCPSEAAMLVTLKRMGYTDAVPHGLRSTFRQYIADKTDFQREVAESALAHQVVDKAEAAYQRTDYLDKRREMMRVWAEYCLSGVKPGQPNSAPQACAKIDRDLPSENSVV